MNEAKVLILSSVYDFAADLVALRLQELRVPFLRINKEQLEEYRFALNPAAPSLSIKGLGVNTEIGADLLSVWFRQPVFLRNTPPYPLSLTEQLSRSQWSAFLRSLSVFDSAIWMNWPQATYLAESKPYQLLIAARCGFNVPETRVGNDAEILRGTFFKNPVVKSLDTVLLREGSDCFFTYSTECDLEELTQEKTTAAPLIAQEYFSEKIDVRVTVIGDKLFAIRILADGKGIPGDWRTVPRHRLTYQDFELPEKLQKACVVLTSSLGLSFAAIDLLETQGGFFFLEVNPTGEWAWISNKGRPLDLLIASWLAAPTVPSTVAQDKEKRC